MFDLGWDEMAIIAVLALIVLGPKELPNALRTVSALMKNARKLASEFQGGVNEIIREADLEDARKKLSEVQSLNKNQISKAIEKAVDPTGEVKAALNVDIDPTGPAKPAEPALPAADAVPALPEGEDHAVEIAAAAPIAPAIPTPATPAVEDKPAAVPETAAPEAAVAEKS